MWPVHATIMSYCQCAVVASSVRGGMWGCLSRSDSVGSIKHIQHPLILKCSMNFQDPVNQSFQNSYSKKGYLLLLNWVVQSISVWYRLLVSCKPVPSHILSFRPNLTTRIDLMCIWAMTYCSMHHCRYFYPCYLLATVPSRIEPGDRLYVRAEDGLVHAISV